MSDQARRLQQRDNALGKANVVRLRRAELKRQIKAGTADPAAIILDPEEAMEGVPLAEFLDFIPRVGERRARRLAQSATIAPYLMLGKLPMRARLECASALREAGLAPAA